MIKHFLKKFRLKHFIGWGLLALICLVFVFFGLPQTSFLGAGFAARVNKKLISIKDLEYEVSRVEEIYSSFSKQQNARNWQRFAREIALQRLITSETVRQQALKEGLNCIDGELRHFLQNEIPFLQEEGRFQNTRYQLFLRNSGYKAKDFEDQICRSQIHQRLLRLIDWGLFPLQQELDKKKEMENWKWEVAYMELEKEKADKLPEEEKQKWNKIVDTGKEKDIMSYVSARFSVKKWETTNSFNLWEHNMGQKSWLDQALDLNLSSSKPFLFLEDLNKFYLVKLKSFENQKTPTKELNKKPLSAETAEIKKAFKSLQRVKSLAAFNLWLQKALKSNTIKKNSRLGYY